MLLCGFKGRRKCVCTEGSGPGCPQGQPQAGEQPWGASEAPLSLNTCLTGRIHPSDSIGSQENLHRTVQHRLVAGNSVSPLRWCP